MSRLDSLIRLHRWQLDEKRRQLVELETMADETRRRVESLDRELQDEARRADERAGQPEGTSWHAYAGNVRNCRRKLEVTVATIEAQIEAVKEEIAAGFQELKKLELVSEARLRRAREAAARSERFVLDEIALSTFRRSAS